MEFLRHILLGVALFLSIEGFSIKSMAFEEVDFCRMTWWQTADLPEVEPVVTQWQASIESGDVVAYQPLCPSGDYSPFELAVLWNPYPEVIDFLLEVGFPAQMGFSTQNQDPQDETILYLAAFNANPEILNVIQSYVFAKKDQENQEILIIIHQGPDDVSAERPDDVSGERNREILTPIYTRSLSAEEIQQLQEQEDSKIYFGVAGGVHSSATMKQEGWNQDSICYPNQHCFRNGLDSPASGYLWAYDISAEQPGMAVEGLVGYRASEHIRIEVVAGLQTVPLQQEFKSLQQRVGSQYIPSETDPHTTVVSPSESYIGDLTIGDVSFNGYVDLLNPNRRVIPFVGGGFGFSGIKINDLDFSQQFEDPQNPKGYTPPLSFYDSFTDGSVFDVIPTLYLHLGFDVNVTDRISVGIKHTLSRTVGDISFRDTYLSHPMNYWPPLQTGLMPQNEELGFHYDTSLMKIQNSRTLFVVKWKK